MGLTLTAGKCAEKVASSIRLQVLRLTNVVLKPRPRVSSARLLNTGLRNVL